MSATAVALVISGLSLSVSFFALGWNVYRDVVLKARVKVRFQFVAIVSQTEVEGHTFSLRVTNHGPGTVHIDSLIAKRTSWWRWLTRRIEHFWIKPDPRQHDLPKKLAVGDRAIFQLSPSDRNLMDVNATHVGVSDSFDRQHWAPARDVRSARRAFMKHQAENESASS